jgi:hypothetical protein
MNYSSNRSRVHNFRPLFVWLHFERMNGKHLFGNYLWITRMSTLMLTSFLFSSQSVFLAVLAVSFFSFLSLKCQIKLSIEDCYLLCTIKLAMSFDLHCHHHQQYKRRRSLSHTHTSTASKWWIPAFTPELSTSPEGTVLEMRMIFCVSRRAWISCVTIDNLRCVS